MRVTSSGLTGGGSYVILRGNGVGRAVVSGGLCAGVAAGLSSSGFTFYGPFSADSSGSGDLSPTVTVDDAGAYVQVLDLTSCELSNAIKLCSVARPEMAVVPAGSYPQGCTPGQDRGCRDDEYPWAPVTLTRSLWMRETEVTQGQFKS